MRMIYLFILFTPLLLASCAASINQRNAIFYHEAGLQASADGNYALAEINFSRVLVNARLGNSPTAGISMATYNFGRAKANLCKIEEAENLLTEALNLEEENSGPKSVETTMRLFELARVKTAQKMPSDAVTFYDRAISNVRELNIEASDPVGFSLVLDDYAAELSKIGSSEKSAESIAEATRLREMNAGRVAGLRPDDYSLACSNNGT